MDSLPSRKQLRGHGGWGGTASPHGQLPSAAFLLFTQRQTAGAAAPVIVSNPANCTVNSLSQGITSGHCIPKELPSEPALAPSGPSAPTNGLLPGRPPAHTAKLGHLLQLLGAWARGTAQGQRAGCSPPPPAPEYPREPALSPLPFYSSTLRKAFVVPEAFSPLTISDPHADDVGAQGWFCPSPREG